MMKSSKIQTIGLFFCAMFLITGMVWAAENLVTNPGFEDGIGSPWWKSSPPHCSSDDATSHSGSKSLRITVTDSQTYVLVGQGVPVIPGESYNISAWIKTENVTGPGAHVCIEWSGPSGWLGGEWSAKKITGTQHWQFSGVSRVKIPDKATSATVYLYLAQGSTGTAWFDDVVVERDVPPLLQTFVLRPNYRGMVLPEASSPEIEVEISLNPVDHGFTLGELEIRVALNNGDNIVVQKNLASLSSNTFNIDLDMPVSAQPGDYDLSIEVHKAESLLEQNTYSIRKLSQEDLSGLTSYVDAHNRFILNGKPFFPIGLYVVQCTNGSYAGQLDEIADSPFDTLMNYSVNACGTNASVEQIQGYLDQLQSRNLKLIFSLKDYIGHGQQDINTITHKVTTFKDYPAILSWYMNDELGLAYLPELEERCQKVRELDESHPVWSVHWNTNWLVAEAHTTDIVGVDPYPIDNNPITLVSQMADGANRAGKPLWLVPQIFDWRDYPSDPRASTGRPPTRDEMRAMTYLAINHGAKGLIYYSYFNILDDDDYNERWPQIKEIAGEIDCLRPVFVSTQQTNDNDIICNNPDIDFKLMREGNTYYLLAVNTKEEAISGVCYQVSLENEPRTVRVLFENDREIAVGNAEFTDGFAPYEVHVYHWKGDCCKGDSDEDGDVDGSDLSEFSPCFGTDCSGGTSCESDFDGDGDVDASDLAAFAADFGELYCPVCQ